MASGTVGGHVVLLFVEEGDQGQHGHEHCQDQWPSRRYLFGGLVGLSNRLFVWGRFSALVLTLVTNVNDKDDEVRNALKKAIIDIGEHQPELTLSTAANYLQSNASAGIAHRVCLLQCMKAIVDLQRQKISTQLLADLTALSFTEMTTSDVLALKRTLTVPSH